MAVLLANPSRLMRTLADNLRRKIPGKRMARSGIPHEQDGWRVYLIQTTTGQLGPRVEPVDGTWSIELNGIEEVTVTLERDDLRGLEERWYTPWVGGVLLSWMQDGVETPWIAGPIVDRPSQDKHQVQLQARGLRELYQYLIIGTDFHVKDRSLGHIMWEYAAVTFIKPGGGLNIVDGSPDPHGRGHERNKFVWNAANNDLNKLMTELSEVEDGPDVMFRPEFDPTTNLRFVRWAVCHGTSASPTIAPTSRLVFDTTVAQGSISEVQVSSKTEPVLSRVWATGSGEGAGTKIVRAEELSLLQHKYPFMESVISNTDEGSDHLLERDALGLLESRIDATDQITITVAEHSTQGVPNWRVGDPAKVVLKGWLAIPDGTVDTRIVKADGDLTSGTVTIDFQTGVWA